MLHSTMKYSLAAVLIMLSGCGNNQAKLINDLKQTGLAYHNYHDQHKQGPPGWNELIAFDKATAGDGLAIGRVRDAGYQVKWNVSFSEVTADMSNTVMADNPSGGPTLIMDGSVR